MRKVLFQSIGGISIPISAATIFYIESRDNAARSKRRSKPKWKGIGYIKMSPDEVVNCLKSMGIEVTRRTVNNYERQKLIPPSERRPLGKAHGWESVYPDNTPAEFYASWRLLHDKKFRVNWETVKDARERALELSLCPGTPKAIMKEIMEGRDVTRLAQRWLVYRAKVSCDIPTNHNLFLTYIVDNKGQVIGSNTIYSPFKDFQDNPFGWIEYEWDKRSHKGVVGEGVVGYLIDI